MGLLNEPNIVWELLNDLDGDTQFVDCSFQLFCPTTSDSSIRKTSDAVRVITIKSDKLDSKSRTDCKSTSNSNNSKDNFVEKQYYPDSVPVYNLSESNSTSLE